MTEVLRVVHDGRPCFWAPHTRDSIPIEGSGMFVGPSANSGKALSFKITLTDGTDTGWVALSENGAKDLIRILAEGLREFEGVTHVPEKT